MAWVDINPEVVILDLTLVLNLQKRLLPVYLSSDSKIQSLQLRPVIYRRRTNESSATLAETVYIAP